jgi:hypothetical protein
MITSKQNPLEEVIISNTLGQVVHRETFDIVKEEIIFSTSLPSGLYLLTARSGVQSQVHKLQIINQL